MSIIDFIEEVCVQTAVYWGNPTPDGYGGMTYADPVEIDCRWDDVAKVVSDAKGKEIITAAQVLVTQDLDLEGVLFLGLLDDLDSAQEDNPMTITGAYSIKRFDKTPLFESTNEFVRKAYL